MNGRPKCAGIAQPGQVVDTLASGGRHGDGTVEDGEAVDCSPAFTGHHREGATRPRRRPSEGA